MRLGKPVPEMPVVNQRDLRKSEKMELECYECGHRFSRKLKRYTCEVKCPKCKGYDTGPR